MSISDRFPGDDETPARRVQMGAPADSTINCRECQRQWEYTKVGVPRQQVKIHPDGRAVCPVCAWVHPNPRHPYNPPLEPLPPANLGPAAAPVGACQGCGAPVVVPAPPGPAGGNDDLVWCFPCAWRVKNEPAWIAAVVEAADLEGPDAYTAARVLAAVGLDELTVTEVLAAAETLDLQGVSAALRELEIALLPGRLRAVAVARGWVSL